MGSSLACTVCVMPNFGMILNLGGRVRQLIGTRSPPEPNKITKPRPAGVVRRIHPEVERIPLALEAEHVTVASIGECHGGDEVPHALIVSLAEPNDPDRFPV